MERGEKKCLENLNIEGGYLESFCGSLSPVKLTDEPSNFVATTYSTVLESLSIYLEIYKTLRKTLTLSHLLLQCTPQGCHWMTASVCWSTQRSRAGAVVRALASHRCGSGSIRSICGLSFVRPTF